MYFPCGLMCCCYYVWHSFHITGDKKRGKKRKDFEDEITYDEAPDGTEAGNSFCDLLEDNY